METILSILRGINVSGHKKILMKDLKAMYEELGFKDISTYIQSGNVIFKGNYSKKLASVIELKIEETFGFNVPVLIRTANEMKTLLTENPFVKRKNIDPALLHVTFLAEEPKEIPLLNVQNGGQDEFEIKGKHVFLYCPGGYGNTKLTNTWFENKLKMKCTTRNWKTVNTLTEMMIT